MEISFAGATRSIVDDWLHSNPITRFVVTNALADLLNRPAELVSESQWDRLACNGMGRRGTQVWSAEVLVQV